MCGISGYWTGAKAWPRDAAAETGRRMADAIRHRGPDDAGVWVGDEGVCLAHRRLAVIDLSPAGHQPMQSHDGRYIIVFNGEIYNFSDLRKEVEGTGTPVTWRGHSDTEVLLEAVARWGLAATLPRLNGMFAFALWDKQERTLSLARDRFGEKPLYYGYAGGTFLFGSELRSLYAHPDWQGELDLDAVADFLRFAYVPAPRSIFQGIRKLMPGSWLQISPRDMETRTCPEPRHYWSARAVALDAARNPAHAAEAELIDETERRMRSAVRMRMAADVPLGAFLSGGIDSSLVVAMMQAQSSQPVRTFSIGVHDPRYNEASDAAQVARHLGTEHTELYVTDSDAAGVIMELPSLYDEPFADASQIPTYLVSRMARQHVTVALSGDGGDELFGGYNRHAWVPRIWGMTRRVPRFVRTSAAGLLMRHSPRELERSFARAARFLPARLHVRTPGDKLHKLAGVLGAAAPADIYAGLVSARGYANELMVRRSTGSSDVQLFPRQPELDVTQWMMLCDTLNYLPDDILTKVDRAAMAVSLESRIPFLDPYLFTWSWQLPTSVKVREGEGKWILRQVLYRHVPRAIINRPKSGFGIPMDALLRGTLQGWVRDTLSQRTLDAHGILRSDAINRITQQHFSEETNHSALLWNLLMLTQWIENYRERIADVRGLCAVRERHESSATIPLLSKQGADVGVRLHKGVSP